MHILVDIRMTNPEDIVRQSYAFAWVELWKKYHPHDTVTYLGFQDASAPGDMIRVSSRWSPFGGKKIAHHHHGPDRVISFSRFAPIDKHIPTLTHIFDNTERFYPREEMGFLGKKKEEYLYRNLLGKSHHIIVPHLEVGAELVELFNIPEKNISVIPYFIPEKNTEKPFSALQAYGIHPGYWIVEGSAGMEWNPFQLLQAYSRYIIQHNGSKRLVITGDLGGNLKHISECIRGLQIMDYVKIVGVLPQSEKETLYAYASGWIYIGGYYGGGPNITYALGNNLPILASDISPIREYADLKIHPNHTDELTEKMLLLSRLQGGIEKYTYSPHMIAEVYARVIAESACK